MAGAGLYFSHEACLEHDPGAFMAGHPEAPGRLEAIETELARHAWLGWERRAAPVASEGELALVHERGYVQAVRAFCARGGGPFDADTFASEDSYGAASRAAGGALAMTRALLAGEATAGFCAVRPPGHHAGRARAMGFCLFNNVALAAELAIRELGLERVTILDWDVHHGNGTADIFRSRADVFYASIHQSGLYPGTGGRADVGAGEGEGFMLNAPVPPGSEEELWMERLEGLLARAVRDFQPQMILISAGFDAHREDPLGGCLLEAGSFGAMARLVRSHAQALPAPVGAVLEGGYQTTALAESVRQTLAGLAPARA